MLEPRAPAREESSIDEATPQRLVRVLRERWLIVALAVAAAVGGTLVYVSHKEPTYQAQANLLISPVTDPNLNGLPLFRTSSDPTRDTQTAALLVDTPAAAAGAATSLHLRDSPQAILEHVQVSPVAGSDVVAVTASARTPAAAAALATAFAQAAINVLSRRLQLQLQAAIARQQVQLSRSTHGGATANGSLSSEINALRALVGGPDPTIQLESAARAPSNPVSPRKSLSLAAAGILGLALGIIFALGADALDPRLRREAQLQDVLGLPILARLPSPSRGAAAASIETTPGRDSLIAQEFLAEALGRFDESLVQEKRAIVFTSADRGTDCTTVAIHHAWLRASTGERVILIDGDPRTPAVGPAMGALPSARRRRAPAGRRPLGGALVSVNSGGVKMRVLAVSAPRDPEAWARMPRGRELIVEFLRDADALVIDAPRLADSVPAVLLARSAEAVVVVATIGETRLDELRELGRLFDRREVRGTGVVLVGGPTPAPGDARRSAHPRPPAGKGDALRSPGAPSLTAEEPTSTGSRPLQIRRR